MMVPNIRPRLRKFARHFTELRDAKANASDTVARLRRSFEQILGFDGVKDISNETEMKGKYVDLCPKLTEKSVCSLKPRRRLFNFECGKSIKPSITLRRMGFVGFC